MKNIYFFLAGIILFASCTSNGKSHGADTDTSAKKPADSLAAGNFGYFKVEGDSLIIPSFKIEISLSAKAAEKLTAKKETIIVAAYFSGQPKDTATKEYMQSGEMSLATTQRELVGDSRTATIDGVKIPKSLYDSLAGKDIQVLINIFSGRRSFKDNLLNCDILQDYISRVQGRTFTLNGKLISEK